MRTENEIKIRLAFLEKIAVERYGSSSIALIEDEGLRIEIYALKWVLDLIG